MSTAATEEGLDALETLDASRLPPNARLRSGTAARLAGLPVTTLRVWERRYGVVAAPKTPTGQRLYSTLDVQRLALLKQLSDRGHAIGTIASLDLPELQGLAATAPARSAAAAAMPGLNLMVVGRGAAQKLHAVGARPRLVFDDLAHAETAQAAMTDAATAASPDVLLVHLPSLHPALAERALNLAKQSGAATLLVLYAFGAETVAESLRAAGTIVRREPCTGRELARLLAAAAQAPAQAAGTGLPAASMRRYSDEQLVRLAEQPSTVLCECPRHLAEIVTQLAHFEQYSAECDARSPADSALHRHLGSLAGAARAMFEQALERVIVDEGLEV